MEIQLPDADAEVAPVPAGGVGYIAEPEIDKLSNIVREFNDLFGGIDWKDEDKILQTIVEELPAKVSADRAYQNAMVNSDKQNAQMEHDNALNRALVEIVTDHTELYKQFQDNESFRNWLKALIFRETYYPKERRLDDDISNIELALRTLIENTLEGDVGSLPPHLVAKARERIQKVVVRDPTKNTSDYESMSSLLEFFDLRELEAVFVSKVSWKHFQERLRNKELFQKRFGQLAELRNALRHSRTLDEVTRKEGEASVAWFKQLMEANAVELRT